MENIVKTYPCGLRMIVRTMPNFKSVATSVFVGVGSCDEEKDEQGLSHFVEHMMFKGTETREGEDIAQTLSSLGVEYNAYTSTNATCYHTRGLITNLDTCCDILSDMYFNMKFEDDEFYREAEVIIQEIAMRDDHPRSALSELCALTFFDGTPYGHSIAGTIKDVRSFKPADIYKYVKKHYTAPNTIIAFAGDISLAQAELMLKKYFLSKFKGKGKPILRVLEDKILFPKSQFVKRKKSIEQQNVAILFPACNSSNNDKYIFTYINEIISADMSSRLFLSVRDKMGLVYSISGGLHLTPIGGYYYIWFSCTPKNTEKVLKIIAEEIVRFKKEGATALEMQKVRNLKQSDRLFESENVEQINQRNVTWLSEFNNIETIEQYLAKVNKITENDVLTAAKKYLNYDNVIVAAVGPAIKGKPFEILK